MVNALLTIWKLGGTRMWPFSRPDRKPAPGTIPIDPTRPINTDLWSIRVFISHRWDRDEQMHRIVLGSLRAGRFKVRDLSVTEDARIAGPRGGRVDDVQIKSVISERIQQSEIVVAPAEPLSADARWIEWELDFAATFRKPVLFLTDNSNQHRTNRKFGEFQRFGLPVRKSCTDPMEILSNVKAMLADRAH